MFNFFVGVAVGFLAVKFGPAVLGKLRSLVARSK